MAEKVLRINGLGYKNIVSDVSFDWRPGEVMALMGANGSGKSTLARLITGLSEPTAGTVELMEARTSEPLGAQYNPVPWPAEGRWREIGFIGQHPRRQTIGASVAEELGFGLLNLGLSPQEVQLRVKELAAVTGLAGKENQSPSTLSGGERQRLVIAAILAMKPAFLILDEALTMLDQRAQDKILSLLSQKCSTAGAIAGHNETMGEIVGEPMGQLWITHDPELAAKADRLLLMKDGRVWDAGRPSSVLGSREVRAEYGLRAEYQIRAEYRIRGAHFAQIEGNRGHKFKEHGHFERVHRDRVNEQAYWDGSSEPAHKYELYDLPRLKILEWENCSYGERLDIDKRIYQGEFVGIIGPSGAGKSTLLESVIGLNLPTAGRCQAFGEVLGKDNVVRQRQRCRLVLQEPGEYFIGHTVYDEVFYGRSRREAKSKKDENLSYLERFGITAEMAAKPPEHLSGGEKQRVALAAAFESKPQVLLLDEPMLGLDGRGREHLLSFLSGVRGEITILCVTHDLTEVIELADRLWLIEDGQVTLDFPASSWQDFRECLQAAGVRCPVSGTKHEEYVKGTVPLTLPNEEQRQRESVMRNGD
ncbi:ATP-binding cassette domain-containing protein [Paradesulfitobacterium aromaticivorans]